VILLYNNTELVFFDIRLDEHPVCIIAVVYIKIGALCNIKADADSLGTGFDWPRLRDINKGSCRRQLDCARRRSSTENLRCSLLQDVLSGFSTVLKNYGAIADT